MTWRRAAAQTVAMTFDRAFEIVVGHEGGFQKHPRDAGNWRNGKLIGTKYGITARDYPNEDIPNLTLERAKQIYYQNYWRPAGCNALAPALALAVFDSAINSGVGRAKQWLAVSRGDTNALLDARLDFLRRLSNWKTFGRGWQKRIDALRGQCAALDDAGRRVFIRTTTDGKPTTRLWNGEHISISGTLTLYAFSDGARMIDVAEGGDVQMT